MEDYLRAGNGNLASGKINNIDRINGWHTDRVRVVLDGSGANTIEDCSADPALGKPETLVALHMLRSALITKFEAMAVRGNDPREAVARELGVARLSRQERLRFAHRLSLREVARYGNDANTYKRLRPGQWLDWMFAAAEEAPHTRLTEHQKTSLRKMYAAWDETEPELRRWCRDNGKDAPNAQAYFDLGLNNAAVYMRAEYEDLRDKNPNATKKELIRKVELGAAEALHRDMRKTTEAPARNKTT
jgi:hypothetical protein